VLYNIVTMIVDTVAAMLGAVLLLRFWMQAIRVRPPSNIADFMYALTDWLVKPLRRILPGVGGYDWASLLAAYLIALLSVLIHFGMLLSFPAQAVLLLSGLTLLRWIIYGFIFVIIIEVILSWVNPYAPLAPFIRAVNEPFMRPLRRVIPPIGNVDLSPLAALLLLQIALYLVGELALRVL
jgi:YggT family protein